MIDLCKFLSAQFSQDYIFRIASVGFKMGDYSHSDALILEVYHILCTSSKVNIPCAQLWKVMTTKMSGDIGGLLTNIAAVFGWNTSLSIA